MKGCENMSLFKRKKSKKQFGLIELKKLGSCDFVAPGFSGIYHKYSNSQVRRSNVYAVYETKDVRNVKYLSGDTLVRKV